ncbi:hypothetical protein M413DRAFT_443264 [Hebeloma cylindrosporum]|uniref:Uncharacterized protein n=1 Tax=Hebeloma cylindrosporum TaxID=76867 RepID=A0A0C2Y332_HEBCY|nr:hypothetical protein M413DRAFT_443264 [Hebeloma cylindrosporum h7]
MKGTSQPLSVVTTLHNMRDKTTLNPSQTYTPPTARTRTNRDAHPKNTIRKDRPL